MLETVFPFFWKPNTNFKQVFLSFCLLFRLIFESPYQYDIEGKTKLLKWSGGTFKKKGKFVPFRVTNIDESIFRILHLCSP